MTGTGRAGEPTFTDLRARLARVTQLLAAAEQNIDDETATVAAERAPAQVEHTGGPDETG